MSRNACTWSVSPPDFLESVWHQSRKPSRLSFMRNLALARIDDFDFDDPAFAAAHRVDGMHASGSAPL